MTDETTLSSGANDTVVSSDLDAPPSQIDPKRRYAGAREIGQGGMGRVLRVTDTALNRPVAMKLLQQEGSSGAARFIQEARITGRLEHPNILPVHDFGFNEEGELFFTMKLVEEHTTLADVIARLRDGDPEAHATYTFERRVQIIQQLCNVLDYAHSRGIVHRDVKPANIIVGDHGEVFLLDWGIAKVIGRPEAPGNANQNQPPGTRDGTIIGTPAYMPPEQIMGDVAHLGPTADVYATAATLYELLTLRSYLGAKLNAPVEQLIAAVVSQTPTPAETFVDKKNGRVPRTLSRICQRGLQKAPEDRFATAADLSRALQFWLEGRGPMACLGTTMQRGLAETIRAIDRSPFWVPMAVIALGVLSLLGLSTAVSFWLF